MGIDRPVEDFDALQAQLGLIFADLTVLRQAFVHRSYLHENPGSPLASNERLEFLGDSLIGLVVAEELYRQRPDLPEGELTKLRSSLVRRDTLARVAAAMDLGAHLFLGRGEAGSGGRRRPANLARVFESLIGAVLIDQGYEAAKTVVLRELRPEFERLAAERETDDFKSDLQEAVQAMGFGPPAYRTLSQAGPDHAKEFTVEVAVGDRRLAIGLGASKQAAEKEAARVALLLLRSVDPASGVRLL